MKINNYSKPKRNYKRKNKYNKLYKGKLTKKQKNINENRAITFLLVSLLFGATYAFVMTSNTITISGAVVKESPKLVAFAKPILAEGVSSSVGEVSVEQQIRNIAKEHNFKQEELLVRIAFCESSFNPLAINYNNNGSSDHGLFQYNSIHKFGELPLDIRWSTEKTIEWIRAGKLHAWNSSKHCWNK